MPRGEQLYKATTFEEVPDGTFTSIQVVEGVSRPPVAGYYRTPNVDIKIEIVKK